MGKLFSGSTKPNAQLTENVNNDLLVSKLSGNLDDIGAGSGLVKALLSGDGSGYRGFKGAVGFDDMMDRGVESITNNRAAQGLLRSGGTPKAIADYATTLEDQYLDNYLSSALGLGGLGISAANVLASSGQRTKKNSSQGKKGLGDIALSAVPFIK